MNRTISCTVREEVLVEAFAYLARNKYTAETLAGLVRLCVEVVAMQLNEQVQEEEMKKFLNIANSGRRTREKASGERLAFNSLAPQSNTPAQPVAAQKLWWQQLGCCCAEEAERYLEFCTKNGLSVRSFTYVDWQKALVSANPGEFATSEPKEKVKVVETPNALKVSECSDELMELARAREVELQNEKQEMEKFLESIKAKARSEELK